MTINLTIKILKSKFRIFKVTVEEFSCIINLPIYKYNK